MIFQLKFDDITLTGFIGKDAILYWRARIDLLNGADLVAKNQKHSLKTVSHIATREWKKKLNKNMLSESVITHFQLLNALRRKSDKVEVILTHLSQYDFNVTERMASFPILDVCPKETPGSLNFSDWLQLFKKKIITPEGSSRQRTLSPPAEPVTTTISSDFEITDAQTPEPPTTPQPPTTSEPPTAPRPPDTPRYSPPSTPYRASSPWTSPPSSSSMDIPSAPASSDVYEYTPLTPEPADHETDSVDSECSASPEPQYVTESRRYTPASPEPQCGPARRRPASPEPQCGPARRRPATRRHMPTPVSPLRSGVAEAFLGPPAAAPGTSFSMWWDAVPPTKIYIFHESRTRCYTPDD